MPPRKPPSDEIASAVRAFLNKPSPLTTHAVASLAIKSGTGAINSIVFRRDYDLGAYTNRKTELATDFLGEALSEKQIKYTIAPLQEVIDDPQRLAARFHSIIKSIILQELPRLWAEHDPEGARIVRNLRDAARNENSPMLFVTNEAGAFYRPRRLADMRLYLDYPTSQWILDQLRKEISGVDTAPSFLHHCSLFVTTDYEHSALLRERDCREAMRYLQHRQNPVFNDFAVDSRNEGMMVSDLVERCLDIALSSKVENLFRVNHATVCDKLIAALRDYVRGKTLVDHDEEPQFEVVKRHLPNLTYAEFRERYYNRFSYAVRIVMEQIKKEVES